MKSVGWLSRYEVNNNRQQQNESNSESKRYRWEKRWKKESDDCRSKPKQHSRCWYLPRRLSSSKNWFKRLDGCRVIIVDGKEKPVDVCWCNNNKIVWERSDGWRRTRAASTSGTSYTITINTRRCVEVLKRFSVQIRYAHDTVRSTTINDWASSDQETNGMTSSRNREDVGQ